ncbi:MAG: DUF3667 domain-containing protein [Nonlabens sp.]|uniref:DUF3667 domain-containing protein n=1 Tax=Nonlabens sp. TaxID=1888209 RepID=UPI00321C0E66
MKPTTRSLTKYRGEECLNCGTPLDVEDKYCHQCGQLNSKKQLALKDFFGEFFSNIFSYDSRIWRTIKHLLFKPGFVSKRFINGKRFSYANPFRFFLSVCIVFFLMIQTIEFIEKYTDHEVAKVLNKNGDQGSNIEVDNGVFSISVKNQKKKEKETPSDKELKEIENEPYIGKYIAEKIREDQLKKIKEDSLKAINPTKDSSVVVTQKYLDSLGYIKRLYKQLEYYESFTAKNEITDPETALAKMDHNNTRWNQAVFEKTLLLKSISDNPSVLVDIILPKLPLFLFLFTPVLTLFLWLLYVRRDFTYMEHLIFAFNVFTFVFLSMIIITVVELISFDYVNLASFFFLFIGPFYLYKAMRNFYNQKRFKTILKFLLVSFIFVIGLIIGISLLLLVGIALY